ncbi:hypothetical protein [Neptuniibacter halophilus]|uniref:hypothetical protein n=1 Tax=Neptuniibacter halophilus TaxID=651666 RepID=UPI002573A832|nr:hypothetical protein [Neptuniibacter halophilus]
MYPIQCIEVMRFSELPVAEMEESPLVTEPQEIRFEQRGFEMAQKERLNQVEPGVA